MARAVEFRVDSRTLARLLGEIESGGWLMLVHERPTEVHVPTQPSAFLTGRWGERWLVLPEHVGLVRSYRSVDQTWVVQNISSPVVNLMVFRPDAADISKAWLSFRPGHYAEDGTWEPRPEDFIRRAERLLRWARRNLERGS